MLKYFENNIIYLNYLDARITLCFYGNDGDDDMRDDDVLIKNN